VFEVMVCFGFGGDGGSFEETGALGELAVPEKFRGLVKKGGGG
jgi:hypothetical protein